MSASYSTNTDQHRNNAYICLYLYMTVYTYTPPSKHIQRRDRKRSEQERTCTN